MVAPTASDLDSLLKSQKVRLFDTFALGPFMIWYAVKSKGMGSWSRRALFVSGCMTIVYNYDNYRKAKAWIETEGKDALENPLQALSDLVKV